MWYAIIALYNTPKEIFVIHKMCTFAHYKYEYSTVTLIKNKIKNKIKISCHKSSSVGTTYTCIGSAVYLV